MSVQQMFGVHIQDSGNVHVVNMVIIVNMVKVIILKFQMHFQHLLFCKHFSLVINSLVGSIRCILGNFMQVYQDLTALKLYAHFLITIKHFFYIKTVRSLHYYFIKTIIIFIQNLFVSYFQLNYLTTNEMVGHLKAKNCQFYKGVILNPQGLNSQCLTCMKLICIHVKISVKWKYQFSKF